MAEGTDEMINVPTFYGRRRVRGPSAEGYLFPGGPFGGSEGVRGVWVDVTPTRGLTSLREG